MRTHLDAETALRKYERALATKDWYQISPLVHESCCFVFTEGNFYGKSAAQQAFERTFSMIEDEEFCISDVVWTQNSDDLAICTTVFKWRGIIDGVPQEGSGRGSMVFVREQDSWYLLHEHLGPRAKGHL